MPTRAIRKTYSDRGKISELANRHEDTDIPMSAFESRIKSLYEFAESSHDKSLKSNLGFITTDYITDKNALPLSVYRIRKTVADIKSKSAGKIDELALEFSEVLDQRLVSEDYMNKNSQYLQTKHAMVKTALAAKPPVFRRVSRL